MIVFGIDPGTATTGYGVVQVLGNDKYLLLAHGLVSTAKELPAENRLHQIYSQIDNLLTVYQPNVVAIERLFFATNALTAIAVGGAIGVIKLAIFGHGLPIYDYAPMQVKLTITGTGKADKTLMKSTVKSMFNIIEKKGDKTHFDNAADAIAIAVCHARKHLSHV
jgi:crossover junction endodeoxyribonuclease RuvC